MQGDFTVKKVKIGKRNLHLTENRLSKNETWCTTTYHCDNYMCHVCAEGFLDSNFNEAVIDKNFTISLKSLFLEYYWNFLEQLFLPNKFYGRNM